ncbi:MAG: hypothetical protein J6V06_03395, partial [Clostridia bacterium]|nr:hypothetical protein [Clostridia bacterium]
TTTGVATLEEAVKRLANVGGTVYFTARYDVAGARITLPTYTETITFRGVVNESGNATSGFINEGTDSVIELGGPSKFDNIVFKGKGINYIVGNWNDLDFGYTRIHDNAQIYLIAGEYRITEDDTAAKDITINLDGATISTGNDNADVSFFERVYLGSYFDADNLTVSNKKVTLNVGKGNHNEAEIDLLYTMSTSSLNKYDKSTTENCETVVNLNDATVLLRGRTGDDNVEDANAGGSLDKLTVNLNDNSTLGGDLWIRNAKETIVNISDTTEGGRTVATPNQLVGMKYGDFVDSESTLTVNTDSHAFSEAVISRASGSVAACTFINNITDVCTWDKGEYTTEPAPGVDGVLKYTCTECGKTKTETVPFVCTAHAYVAKADGTYYCANQCGTVDAPTSPVIISAAPEKTVVGGEVTVVVSVKATTPILTTRFAVNAPKGFTLTSVTSEFGEASETSTGFTITCQNELTLPYEVALLNMAIEDATIDAEVLTLKFSVADTVAVGDHVISVNFIETYNFAEEAVETAAVSAEVTVAAAHTHNYKEVVTAPTCEAAGYTTYTCDCGDTYKDNEGDALGHNEGVDTAVAPDCTNTG